ncbi:hypothetical protein [Gaetbulibacter sp. PBL-D1]|uniref:hypothetical protein n=1 Tax=Gaetbulibacter sp. PBL-D1 TaxID=3422594 RepID=UPI003D2ECB08
MFKELLREYIDFKGFSQTEIAEIVGDSQQAVSDFLSKDGNPHKKTREKYFTKLVGFKEFYNEKTSKNTNDIANNLYVNEPLSYIKNKNGLNYEELPNGKWLVKVPKVPYKAYASFIEVFEDEYRIKEAFGETYFTVDHPGKGRYFAFVVGNDSMNGGGINDTPNGAEVLGRELQRHHWKDGINDCDYGWIIISYDGMFHKDINGPNENGFIKCKSRNPSPEFPDFDLDLNTVHTIWKVIKRTF